MGTKRTAEEHGRLRAAYEQTAAFGEALVVVQHDLQKAAELHPKDVNEFLSWVRTNGSTARMHHILRKISTFHREVVAALRLYMGFALRFHLHLEPTAKDGKWHFVPIYEPRHSQLKLKFIKGKLVAPPVDPDADVRDIFASSSGLPAQIRRGVKRKGSRYLLTQDVNSADAKLIERGQSEKAVDRLRAVQRRRGCNPEDEKFRFVEVDSDSSSEITQLLDIAYDPLSVTFLLISSRQQTRLLCLVGELASDKEWNQLGAVRAAVHKIKRGKMPAGAPIKLAQFAQEIQQIPPDGKIIKSCVTAAMDGKGKGSGFEQTERRLQRAKQRLYQLRGQITI